MPFCPGHELSGLVHCVGSNIAQEEQGEGSDSFLNSRLQVGDRVAIPFILSCGHCYECAFPRNNPTVCLNQEQPGFTRWGSFAEYVLIPRAVRNVHKIPDGVSFVEAAALGCRFTTAYRAVVQQGLKLFNSPSTKKRAKNILTSYTSNSVVEYNEPKVVAVFGCGGLGLSCIMIAQAFRKMGKISKIIGIDVSSAALKKAYELGADHVVNARNFESDEALRKKVLELTGENNNAGTGADISIDAAGMKKTCENAVHCTKRSGRMIQVGLPIGGVNRPIIPMGLVAGRELELVGSHGFSSDDLPHLLNLVKEKKLNVASLIERECSLEEGARVLMDMDRSSPLGITMITQFETNNGSSDSVPSPLSIDVEGRKSKL